MSTRTARAAAVAGVKLSEFLRIRWPYFLRESVHELTLSGFRPMGYFPPGRRSYDLIHSRYLAMLAVAFVLV
jgi:hypothetical protein